MAEVKAWSELAKTPVERQELKVFLGLVLSNRFMRLLLTMPPANCVNQYLKIPCVECFIIIMDDLSQHSFLHS